MKPDLFSTSLLIALLLPPTLAIRADAKQNRGDLPPISTTPLAQLDPLDNSPTPKEVQTAAQQITVRVTSAQNGGSGVLVAQKGTTYLVLTNRHVTGRDTQFQIQTPDGQKHTARLVPNTGINPKYDLALLQFTSSKPYQLAKFKYEDGGGVTPLDSDRAIYSVGFPFDSERLRFSNGKVSQLSDVPLEDGTQIGYTIDRGEQELRQGMSGGPIIDAGGLVIGINAVASYPLLPSYTYFDGSKPTATRAAQYQQANWGIPIYNFLTQLDANILYNYDNFPKVQRQVTPTGYMAKLNRETRQQTVRIEDSAGNGSGVIVAKQGDTYYVLTAKHVLETPPTDKAPKQLHTEIKVITHEQEIHQIQPSNIRLAEGLDLAVVKFTSKVNYPVARLGNYSSDLLAIVLAKIGGGRPVRPVSATVFAAGYPGREKIDSPLWQWQLNPGRIEDREIGIFQTQNQQSFSNGYDIIYSSISYSGMSGGPVFDTDGRVIGIHGKAEGEKRGSTELILGKSLGISIQTFIGVRDRLQVPNLLQISSNLPKDLNSTDRATVITVHDSIDKPQAESSGEQWLQYGNQLYRIGKDSDAALAFDKAIATGQKYKLLGNYGKALALWGVANSQALTAISTAISAVPKNERKAYYYLWRCQSEILKELGKYDDALKSIDVAISLEPSDITLQIKKAVIFVSQKKYSEANVILNSITSRQHGVYLHTFKGLIKTALGDYKGAITELDQAIALSPNTGNYYARGFAKGFLAKYEDAIIDFDRVIAISPNFDEAYYHRGNAKNDLGQKQAAIADYDRAIAINPNYADAYINRGNAKNDLGQKQAAIADYDRAIAINPKFAKAYSNRGKVKSDLGQYEEAITNYDQAIIINHNFTLAYYLRGSLKARLGQKNEVINEGIADLNKAIALDSKYVAAYNDRGNAKSKLGQYQAAIADFDWAITLNPKYGNAYANRGEAKIELGQKQTGIDDLNRAAELFRQQRRIDLSEQIIETIKKTQADKK